MDKNCTDINNTPETNLQKDDFSIQLYRTVSPEFNPFPFIGMGCLIICIALMCCALSNGLEVNSTLNIILILIATAAFWASIIFFASSKGYANNGKTEAFAQVDDNKIFYVFTTLEEAIIRHSNIGKIAATKENMEINSRNEERINLMDSPQLIDFLKAYISDDKESDAYKAFAGNVRCVEMENPHIIKRSFSGCKFYFTSGKHQTIYTAFLNKRNEGFDKIYEIIKGTPCKVDYTGKTAGDYFRD